MNTSPSPFSNSSLSTGGNVANAHAAFGCAQSGPYCARRHSGYVGMCVSRIATASGTEEAGGGGEGEGERVGKCAEIERGWERGEEDVEDEVEEEEGCGEEAKWR